MWMDNDLLSGVLILLLFHEAACLSWWHMLLPESKGCHTPWYWDAQAQVQCSVPMLICRCDRDQRALDGLCPEAWDTRRSQ